MSKNNSFVILRLVVLRLFILRFSLIFLCFSHLTISIRGSFQLVWAGASHISFFLSYFFLSPKVTALAPKQTFGGKNYEWKMRCGKGKDPRVADDETFVSDSQIPLSFPPSAHQLVFFSFLPTGTKIIGWWKEKKSWWLAVGLPDKQTRENRKVRQKEL